jgi:hypothetical protein
MEQMMEKVTEMIDTGQLSEPDHLSVLSKLVALVVNKSAWHEEHGDYVLLLTSQFLGRTQLLRPVQVIMLARVLLIFGEPVSLYYEVYHRLVEIINERQFEGQVPMITCVSYILRMNNSALPLREVETLLERLIDGPHMTDHISEVYDIVRSVGLVNDSLMDRFFEKSFDVLKDHDQPYELLRFASRYTNFFSPYTGQYKNPHIEAKMADFVLSSLVMTPQLANRKVNWRDLEENKMGVHPNEFAQKISLLLSFGMELEPAMVARLDDFFPNLGPEGLQSLSRGIQAYRRRNRTRETRTSAGMRKIDELQLKVSEASNRYIERTLGSKVKRGLNDVTFLYKTFANSGNLSEESNYSKVVEMVREAVTSKQMSTHNVRVISNAIVSRDMNMANTELLDALVDFLLARPDPTQLHISFIGKVLGAAAETGHRPPDRFLEVLDRCLHRDADSINGLHSLLMAKDLCSYDHFSKDLAGCLFSNEFMRRLDREMEMCGSRMMYPKKLRHALMELNRAVVLRFPQYGVPWFHQNYCAEHRQQMLQDCKDKGRFVFQPETLHHPYRHRALPRGAGAEAAAFRQQVYEVLCSVLGGWRFIREDVPSRYFNHVDFEVVIDSDGRPVDLASNPLLQERAGRRVAVQVVPSHLHTADTLAMLDRPRVAARELELEGWQVVVPSPHLWQSMALAEPQAKATYLQGLLGEEGPRRSQERL